MSVVCVQEKKICGFPLQNSLSVSVLPTRRLPYKTTNCPPSVSYLSFKNFNSASLPINVKSPPHISNRDLLNRDLIPILHKKQEPTHLSIHSSILDFIYPMCYKVNSVYQTVSKGGGQYSRKHKRNKRIDLKKCHGYLS